MLDKISKELWDEEVFCRWIAFCDFVDAHDSSNPHLPQRKA